MVVSALVLAALLALLSSASAFQWRVGVGWNNRMTAKLLRPADILNPAIRMPTTTSRTSFLSVGIPKISLIRAVQGNKESNQFVEQPKVWRTGTKSDTSKGITSNLNEKTQGTAATSKEPSDVVNAEPPVWKKHTAQSIASKVKLELMVQPSKRIVQLDYDFQSKNSIYTIKHKWWRKKLPPVQTSTTSNDKQHMTGMKSTECAGDAYLVDWWRSAQKWGLLTDTLLSMVKQHQPVVQSRTPNENYLFDEPVQLDSKVKDNAVKQFNRSGDAVATSSLESSTMMEHVETAVNNGTDIMHSPDPVCEPFSTADSNNRHIDNMATNVKAKTASQSSVIHTIQPLFVPVSAIHVEPGMSTLMKEKVAAASALAAKKRQKQHNSARGNKLYKQKRRLLQKAQQKAMQQRALLAQQQQTANLSFAFPADTPLRSSSVPVPVTVLQKQTAKTEEGEDVVPLAALQALCRSHQARVIAIGDVHGCVDELCDLLKEVGYMPGDQIVLLGDLVAKGPKSVDVVRMAMDLGALSVRGNHDHELVRKHYSSVLSETDLFPCSAPSSTTAQGNPADKAGKMDQANDVIHQPGLDNSDLSNINNIHALLDNKSVDSEWYRKLSKHAKIAHLLSPEELAWIGDLPYIIQSDDLKAVFVHAGLQKNLSLEDQQPTTVMNMCSELTSGRVSIASLKNFAWAPQWEGPKTVYFGHDTSRGLQLCPWAYGLDTGCVYGGNLTAMLLPEQNIVSVRARKTYVKLHGRNQDEFCV